MKAADQPRERMPRPSGTVIDEATNQALPKHKAPEGVDGFLPDRRCDVIEEKRKIRAARQAVILRQEQKALDNELSEIWD